MSEPNVDTQAVEGNNLPSLCFHVENLGCIKSGKFEAKPLTLLCGPNNTGKTWAMYALHGFLDSKFNNQILPEDVLEELAEKGICSWDFGAWLESHAEELLDIINQGMRRRLPEIFNAPESVFADSRFDWDINQKTFVQSGIRRALDFPFPSSAKSPAFHFLKPAGESSLQITLFVGQMPHLKLYLSAIVLNHLMGGVGYLRVFLMPAERNGLELFYRELTSLRSAILHPSNRADLNSTDKSNYSKPIADYIDWLNDIPITLNETSQYQALAGQVESIVGGNYRVDSWGNIYFTPDKSKRELDFHLSSSTVKSLFSLWFYLKHKAKPGDTLMIDEPELNLHPANQRALARVLVRLVNKGLRVVVSTHSDYIVREINNLIMMHTPFEGREELAKKFHYEDENSIGHERVAAYLFDGGTIKPMEVGPEEGVIAETFDEVINALNKSSNEIFYTKRDAVE